MTHDESQGEIQTLQEESIEGAIEAILMVTDSPISLVALATALEIPVNQVRDAVGKLKTDYDLWARGFEVREVAGGWRIYVGENYDWAVKMFIANENPTKLSQAALETLAVIAYKQPIARGQIASIRGVNVDSVVRTLTSRGLVTELYTDSETGAIHYGTTTLLLEQLGINSLDQLPPISPYLPDNTSDFNEQR